MYFLKYRSMLTLYVLLLVFRSAAAAVSDEVQTVTIGFVGPLSGISELTGKGLANAAELAIEDANRNPYKIGGKRIVFRLVRMDDRGDPDRAQQVANSLVQAGVIGVIGSSNSTTSIAGAKVYAAAGIAQISPAATSRKFTELGYRTIFRTIGGDNEAVPYLADYLINDLHVNRIAVVSNGITFADGITTHLADVARDGGAMIVMHETVEQMASNFDDILRRVKAKGVDAIFFAGYAAQASTLAQSMARMEVKARLVISMMGVAGSSFFIAAGTAGNGTLAQETGLPFNKMSDWKKFETDYTQRFGFNLYGLAPFSYDAAQVLIAAVRQANSLDPRKIVDALHRISYRGLTGTISFDANGNLKYPSFTIYEAQNQKWVALKTYTVR